MKKIYLVISAIIFMTGCATVQIPRYIQDQQPYEKNFFASYDETLKVTQNVLEVLGWSIAEKMDPFVYERSETIDNPYSKQIVLITRVRQRSLVVGTRYRRLNVYVRSEDDKTTDVEIRYLAVTALPYSTIRDYKNDSGVKKILDLIEEKLSE